MLFIIFTELFSLVALTAMRVNSCIRICKNTRMMAAKNGCA